MSEHNAEKDAPVGYRRDRSFYDGSRPSNTPKKVHREALDRRGMAACDTRRILLDTDAGKVEVTDLNRCRRCFPARIIPPGADGE